MHFLETWFLQTCYTDLYHRSRSCRGQGDRRDLTAKEVFPLTSSGMEYLFKRRRVLKTCITLSLVFATLVTIHKLKLVEEGAKGSLAFHTRIMHEWLQPDNSSSKSNSDRTGNPRIPEAVDLPPPRWDINESRCPENTALRRQPWFKHVDPRFHQFIFHRHCRYFPLLLNHPEKCQGDIHLLIVVKSIIEQHDRRDAVRRTWGKEKEVDGKKIRTLFLLGTTSTGKDHWNLQRLIEQEDHIYGDILQWDFMDTFFNLTLKEVNFLKWFHIYCPSVEFIFKGDDDIFVNTENVLDFIAFKKDDPLLPSLFVGDIISRAVPIRNKQSKYFIPKELYDKPYPVYAGGGGFLMASPLARRLFVASEGIQLFPIDDVFLGLCLKSIGVEPKLHPGFRTFGISKKKSSAMNKDPCFYKSLLVVHKLSSQDLLKMWEVVHHEKINCGKEVHF
ncbi:PREDICTED: UDP-GlcNAc:betaGal beta-1,3-N-acetylglucosaminyltransferase 7-like [Nanorana parkeri]|uniref:UDP-GlcNAc:betaGal beta-1,3-N-acetylglucosaminyltransferase 7-like n=1 Tax=Nanorana parkeri TaxID=125878 RepID=UPI000853FEE2|nr:PREDICTED: UDP-GlcNAc:betaGal beta-1,3-N-acetylglucosaminyltransferase 7-like [Nanorana parkeri]